MVSLAASIDHAYPNNTLSSGKSTTTPTEIDNTLSRLSSYKNVRGVLVLTRQGSILRQSGPAFENTANSSTTGVGEEDGKEVREGKGKVYARAVRDMVEAVAKGVEDVEDGVSL